MSKNYSHRFLVILSFLAIYLIWGTTYLAIAIGVSEIPPFMLAFIRFASAGLIMVVYVIIKGEKFPTGRTILNNFIVGSIILVGGQGLLIWSEQYITSGYASILIATLPLWFVVMDRRHWKLYFGNPLIIIGLVLGFIGIMVLFRDKLNAPIPVENMKLQLMATIAVLVGGVCWVIGTLYYRSNPSPGTMYSNLGWQLVLASIVCLAISTFLGETKNFDWDSISISAWSSVLYLSLAGSIIAFVAYTWLLKEVPSAIVSTYAYINPIIAVFVGWLIADELISGNQVIGMIIILSSAVLVNLNRGRALSAKN
ncbi:MAG: drug/metabolite transporter (DMT)-like permease [Cyclobacteriaceae bacterium]|jgi:drug/metabolite transporter (DMT)-like permease